MSNQRYCLSNYCRQILKQMTIDQQFINVLKSIEQCYNDKPFAKRSFTISKDASIYNRQISITLLKEDFVLLSEREQYVRVIIEDLIKKVVLPQYRDDVYCEMIQAFEDKQTQFTISKDYTNLFTDISVVL